MATTTLGTGVYDLAEASYLLGVSEATLAGWSRKTARGEPPLVPPTHGWAYSFHDLLSLAVVAVFYQRKVNRAGVRLTIEYLEKEYRVPRPLADKRVVTSLTTSAGHVMWQDRTDVTRGGQQVLVETVRQYLTPVEYGSDFLARLWRPARSVELDPTVQAGSPCIVGTRVTTDVVAARVAQGEPASAIAADLFVSTRQVTDAVRFENQLRDGHGLALVS